MLDLKFNSGKEWDKVSGKYLGEFTLQKNAVKYDEYLQTLDILGERMGEGRKEKIRLFGLIPISMTIPSGIKCWLHFDQVEEYLLDSVKSWDKDEVLDYTAAKPNALQFVFESGMKIVIKIQGAPQGYLKDL